MDKLYNMSVFTKVVEMGSFTAVANHLSTTVGNISRAVTVLEEGVNARLLQRSTRRLAVTDAGRRFYERCVAILGDVERAEAEAGDALIAPRGVLRVHAVPGLGRQLVARAAMAYRQIYPDVSVDLLLSQRMPNLLEEQLDVGIVIARSLPDSNYVTQKIGVSHCILAASPAYLEQHSAPRSPQDLARHSCVLLSTVDYAPDAWHLEGPEGAFTHCPTGAHLGVNDMDAMATALRDGAGLGLIAGFSAIEDLRKGTLVRVLPGYYTNARNVYALYPSRQFVDAKTKLFVDALKLHVGDQLASYAAELGIAWDEKA
ncbi:LysR family transcriptional regulator [Achromobacter seleniivolatilans]|uniref:LysR family transcriptional regulator n=1 Tax=Achromobacter seleniivolatilans TaxID=3047478 RepID=A0ABY9LWV7_9BURK|nr:LysR family transcriptional regulator [Achromobacter sp. R39]WMD18970.1 LysR family transcriptional regulator [Achromobacter sp. R39]